MAFPTRLQQLLEEGRIVVHSLGEFQFGTGFWYMWNSSSEFVWNCNTAMNICDEIISDGSKRFSAALIASCGDGVTHFTGQSRRGCIGGGRLLSACLVSQ
ncbi:hypothetical protein [Ochrobactrum quorumnocens]|uniref:hypothetical protein n=1 Tax=Ochrobactrum quorumnocens TaxID=271865 RepID=UPI000A4F68CF|nr:hypothetical protein [[Ochrobactrum] quorumnocens]